MDKFTTHQGSVIPMDRPNIDTDAIIPKQYLKSVKRTGFGINLFDDWRYLDAGEPDMDHSTRRINPDFILNNPRYSESSILLARENFGCGSSREHAVWALTDYGIRSVIAPSFADIFFNNSFKNGLLPIVLPASVIDTIFAELSATDNYDLVIDLQQQQLKTPSGESYQFEVDKFRKYCLLNGLDDIGLSLRHKDAIRAYEASRKKTAPWLFAS